MTLDPGHELPQHHSDSEALHRYAYTHLSSLVCSYLQGEVSREGLARAAADIEVQVQADLNRISMACYQRGLEAGRHALREDRQVAAAVGAATARAL